ncbi:CRISPR-associated exonuclease Cas4 [Marinitoga hydrogenitolerans DSM 16785]|uniref:CRISPR-associated exonuclease Cas4 n=1 Tax=Marinitoga hydrogenitolerans (strain DSM 16785 / JCM 12826 / AT1271) TaxID=1122195 RepID=A0A1M4Z5E4_MARH1|nr:CRISPR-associated protein Cas4 [Marinitoga hydrogenitolerans]SHF12816.1 CRISPR-associated exonuclease Cas4 [Marinitoga hydrogenitolerans DSM 16785]
MVTGIEFYYYFVCKRKLWFFTHGISMEDENEDVKIGKLIEENYYKNSQKNIMINEEINIDYIKKKNVLHEIKKSQSLEEASIWQLKYYIYYLNKRGVNIKYGIIDYPKIKKRIKIEYNLEDEKIIEKVLIDINNIKESRNLPKKIDNKICKKCAYYEFCYI